MKEKHLRPNLAPFGPIFIVVAVLVMVVAVLVVVTIVV